MVTNDINFFDDVALELVKYQILNIKKQKLHKTTVFNKDSI